MTTMRTPATRSPAVAVRRPRRRLAEYLGLLRRRPRTGRRAERLHPLLLPSAGTVDGHAGAPITAPGAAPVPVAAAAVPDGRRDIVRGATAAASTTGRLVMRTEAARRTRIDVELLRTRPRIF